jgi:anti-sigma regulatory factor (Ser/Thr protein kinase)
MPSGTQEEDLVIENRLGELSRAELWLSALMEAWSVPEQAVFAVDLVMNEAVTNVISHAYRDDRTHEIRISLRRDDDAIEIEVIDDGEAFDPLSAPAPVVPTDLEGAAIGGRGIHLIGSFTDDQQYRRDSGLNHLWLRIRTSGPEADG